MKIGTFTNRTAIFQSFETPFPLPSPKRQRSLSHTNMIKKNIGKKQDWNESDIRTDDLFIIIYCLPGSGKQCNWIHKPSEALLHHEIYSYCKNIIPSWKHLLLAWADITFEVLQVLLKLFKRQAVQTFTPFETLQKEPTRETGSI